MIQKTLTLLFYCLCIHHALFTHKTHATEEKKQTVCLSMIVKNERAVIKRCLESVIPIIDYWVIVDTGSNDGTQDIIKQYMEQNNIPGELHEKPWKNFAHNRNEALMLAKGKGTYIFTIDADEYVQYTPGFQLLPLDKDLYYMTVKHLGVEFARIQFLNNALDWKYVGVLHEIINPGMRSCGQLSGLYTQSTIEGARSQDPKKYEKDAEILLNALKEDPNNSRYTFYLAKSYQDAGNHQEALKYYQKRISMAGWDEETFWALLQIAIIQEILQMPQKVFINSYKNAYQFRPSRVEPLYYLANFYRRSKNYQAGYEITKLALSVPESHDLLFIQKWMTTYGIPLEYSICAYWLDDFEQCEQMSLQILQQVDLPMDIRSVVKQNIGFAKSKLLEKICEKHAKDTQNVY